MNTLTLAEKGGVMLFTVERTDKVYRGAVILSPMDESGKRTRIISAKVYRYNSPVQGPG